MKKHNLLKMKKGLSLFLAVLMLLTSWVWVAPEKAEAVVYTKEEVETANKAELAKISGSTDIVANVVGRFTNSGGTDAGDLDSEVSSHGSTYYKNVLYSPDNTWGSQAASVYHTDSKSTNVTYYMFYPTTVLMYDGNTTPQMGAVFCVDPSDNYKAVMQSVWLKSGANGLALGGNWKGYTSGEIRFYLNMTNGTEYLSTTGSKEGSLQRTTAEDNWEFFANTIRFTGSMGDSEYSRTIKPTWGFLTGTNQYYNWGWKSGASHNTSATASTPIYVVNVKPLKAAYTEALAIYNEINSNPDIYTTASVKEFVTLANALLAANPNNYNWSSNTATQVSNYTSAAKTAVDNWNAWGGLKKYSRTVSFDNLLDFTTWMTRTPSSATLSNKTANSFTLTSNSGASEGTFESPEFPVVAGKQYKIDLDCTGTGWDVYIFFRNDSTGGTGISFSDGNNRFSSNGTGNTTQIFTAPTGATKACIRVDANGSSNAVTFSNIRVFEEGKVLDGVSYITNRITVTYGEGYGELPKPTKNCWTFAGWVDENGNKVEATTKNEARTEDPQVLYSTWKDEKHTYGDTWHMIDGDVINHVKYCDLCNEAYYGEHNWNDGEITTKPTCTETGIKTYTCTDCGITKTETVDAQGHNFTGSFVNKDNESGHYMACSRCGQYGFGSTVGGTLEHTWTELSDKQQDPTCTATGTKYYKCYTCGAEKTETIPALGHNFNGAVVMVTDGKDGTHYRKCTRCNVYGIDGVEGATQPHSFTSEVTKEPTCTETGIRKYTCTECTATYEEVIDATGHEEYDKAYTEPTCSEKGYWTYTCKKCDYAYTETDEDTPLKDHTYTYEITLQPTCQKEGKGKYTCSACGHSYEVTIPVAEDHNYQKEEKPATCTEDGYIRYVCGCGAEDTSRHEVLPKLGHEYETTVTPPTCTEQGYTTHTCIRGDHEYTDTYVDALGHDFSGECVVNVPGKDGNHYYKCSRFDECQAYGVGKDANETEPHSWCTEAEAEVITPATCTEDGLRRYTCSGCDDTYDEVIPATGHLDVVATPALDKSEFCGEQGYQAFWTCKICNRIYKDEEFENEISSYDEYTYVGEVKVPNELLDTITQHKYIDDYIVVVSGQSGTHAKKCKYYDNCGGYDEASAEAHNFSGTPVGTEATHIKDGALTYTCPICNDSYSTKIDRDPLHAYERTESFYKYDDEISIKDAESVEDLGVYTEPTCITRGYTIYTCPCGLSIIKYDAEEPSHDYTDWTVTDASCTDDGEKTRTCKTCGEVETVKVTATGHKFGETTPAKEATCDINVPVAERKGNEAYKQCTVCSLYFAENAGENATNGVESAKAFEISAPQHTFFAGGNDTQNPDICENKDECGHKYHDAVVTEATCMAAATYKVCCDRCGAEAADIAPYSYGTALEHKFEGEIKANEDGTHSYACTYNCGTYGGAVDCEYNKYSQITGDDVNHNVACKDCGHTKAELHNFPEDWKSDDNGKNTKTCELCGYVIVTECEYELDEEASTEPTCDTEGTLVYKCKDADCGSTYTEKVAPLGHALAEKEDVAYLVTPATCKADAVYKKACSRCDYVSDETWTKEGSMLVHDWNEWVQSEKDGVKVHTRTNNTDDCTETEACSGGVATCVDEAVCSVCSGEYGDVDAYNHKLIETVEKVPATCQTAGTEAYRKCTACDTAVETPVAIPVVAHVFTDWAKVDGENKHSRYCTTCDEDADKGLTIAVETDNCSGGVANCTDKAKCTVCKAEYGEKDASVHKTEANHLDTASVIEATCQKKGFSGNYVYDCCGEIKVAGEETDMLDHTFVEETKVPSTCTVKGSVTYKCSTCVEDVENGLEIKTKTEELDLDPKNHASTETKKVNEKAATCTEDGYTGDEYYVCCYDAEKTEFENRKALKQKGTTIVANGEHTYGDAIPEYLVSDIIVTVDENGKVTNRRVELVTKEPTYEEMIAKRHSDNKWYHIQICSECFLVKYTACSAYEHTYNCVDTDECSVCEGLCSLRSSNTHKNLAEVEAVAATCTATGMKAYYKCDGCNKEYLDEAGKKELKKDEDGKYTHAELVTEKADHDFDTTVKYPGTGADEGKEFYRCKNYKTDTNPNGCTAVQEVVPEGGEDEPTVDDHEHVWSTDYKVTDEATCTEHGYEAIYCTVEGCDEIKSGTYRQITALGHLWNDGEVTTAATCEADGVKTFTCTRGDCKVTKTEAIEKLGHDWDDGVVTKQATCKEAGEMTYTCKNDASHTKKEVIAKGQHVVGDEIIRTEPGTCVKPAINWTACSVCGTQFSSEGEVDLTNHGNIVVVPGKEATCVSDGYTDAKVCLDCDTVLQESVEVSHEDVPHHDHNGDGYCDECSFDMYTGDCDCICHKDNILMKIFYKIAVFFWKIFGTNQSCRCGATHY